MTAPANLYRAPIEPDAIQVGDIVTIYEPRTDLSRRRTSVIRVTIANRVAIKGERLRLTDLAPTHTSSTFSTAWLRRCVVRLDYRPEVAS